jgi:uncharacterized protein YecT (DUF1311 family)
MPQRFVARVERQRTPEAPIAATLPWVSLPLNPGYSFGHIARTRGAFEMRAELKSAHRSTPVRGISAAALVAIFLGVGPAGAADREFSKDFDGCMDKAGGVTPAMIDCMSAELKRQDGLLNENYRKLMASLSTKRKKALQEAQRAWLKFRDTNCDFYYDPDGGTAARVDANECLLNATTDRAKELAQLAR